MDGGTNAAGPERATTREGRTNASLRWAGVALLPLLVLEGALGILAAGTGGSEAPGFLAAHLALGVALLGVSGWATLVARHLPNGPARYGAVVAFLAIASATSVGTFFLLSGNGSAASIDRELGLLALAGAAVMVVWGSVRLPKDASVAGNP